MGWYHQGIGIAKPWGFVVHHFSPLTDATPTKESKPTREQGDRP